MADRRDAILTACATAFEYAPDWLAYQLLHHDQPSVALCISVLGIPCVDVTLSHPRLAPEERLTADRLLLAGSLAKPATAAGIMYLVERGQLRLDARAGAFVPHLPPAVADLRIEELLSHSAGLSRDGTLAGVFDSATFPDRDAVCAAVTHETPGPRRGRMTYSNLGYALLGLIIEAATSQDFATWMEATLLPALGMRDSLADLPSQDRRERLARGRAGLCPEGTRRVVVPGQPARAYAPASGLVSTARDLATLMWNLALENEGAALSPESRRAMLMPRVADEAPRARQMALGLVCGAGEGMPWFGHAGLVPGFACRAMHLIRRGISIALAAPAVDAPVQQWMEGVLHMITVAERAGAPSDAMQRWRGRFWSPAGATDLVPTATEVLVVSPGAFRPFAAAERIAVQDDLTGIVTGGSGLQRIGARVALTRTDDGAIRRVRIGADILEPAPR
jgi:D-alanyl-D-alanine carboxypeptidase